MSEPPASDPPAVAPAGPPAGPSRRSFLKATGIAAAGVAGGGAIGGSVGAGLGAAAGYARANEEFAPLDPRAEPGFDHVVVLMFENRSFDNLLGRLYPPGEPSGQSFDGLFTGRYRNAAADGTEFETHVYAGATDAIMGQPNPDPGEEYPHVNTQLFGIVDPPGNADLLRGPAEHPFNAPGQGRRPDNSGFVRDYDINFRRLRGGTAPTPAELRVAMGGFSPEMLPVTSALARGFAVFDAWFCAVPSQTFCNRSFFHASTSHGFVTNEGEGGYSKWLGAAPVPTIFDRLDEAGLSWRVYYDAAQIVSLTGVLHAPSIEKFWKTNFRTMEQFHADAAAGTLPVYAFIEPRMTFNHNDMHPPVGTFREADVDGIEIFNGAVSDVRAGEALLHEVYTAIRTSASATGSNANNTLLLVTFDEHGGIFDHVAPPAAIPPGETAEPGEMGFGFDRLGCRVPAIAISAYTRAGTVIHDEMHHAAVIRTLSRLHGLRPLTRWDAEANDLFGVVNLSAPRAAVEWPVTQPQYSPPNPESSPEPHGQYRDRPLSSPAQGLLGLLNARYGAPGEAVPRTYGQAFDALLDHGTGLFGTTDAASPAPRPGRERGRR